MKGYGLYYDEATRKVAVREFDVGNGSYEHPSTLDFSHVNETNMYDGKNGFHPSREVEQRRADEINADLASGSWLLRKCKDCGDYFLINDDEIAWFECRDLSIPRRCYTCRCKRKGN